MKYALNILLLSTEYIYYLLTVTSIIYRIVVIFSLRIPRGPVLFISLSPSWIIKRKTLLIILSQNRYKPHHEYNTVLLSGCQWPQAHRLTTVKRDCKYCGRSHPPRSCPAYGKTCKNCPKLNHFAIECQQKSNQTDKVRMKGQAATNDDSEFCIQTNNLQIHTIVVRERECSCW